jgi:hypothetical protein
MAATSYKDRISETSTFTGGGTVALLGAVNGFASFTRYNASQSGIPVLLEAIDASNQPTGDWEVSLCTLSADKRTLTRNTVRDSSNAGALVSFGAGTKRCTVVNDGMSIEGKANLVGGNAFTGAQSVAGSVAVTGNVNALGGVDQDKWLSEKYFTVNFVPLNASVNQKVKFFWPNPTRLQGRVEITAASGFDYTWASGYVRKTFGMHLTEGGGVSIMHVNSEGAGSTPGGLSISDIQWDAASSRWYVIVGGLPGVNMANMVGVTIKTYATADDANLWWNMAASKVVMEAPYVDAAVSLTPIPTGISVGGTITASGAITSTGTPLATVGQLANYVAKSGDTMTGGLIINSNYPNLVMGGNDSPQFHYKNAAGTTMGLEFMLGTEKRARADGGFQFESLASTVFGQINANGINIPGMNATFGRIGGSAADAGMNFLCTNYYHFWTWQSATAGGPTAYLTVSNGGFTWRGAVHTWYNLAQTSQYGTFDANGLSVNNKASVRENAASNLGVAQILSDVDPGTIPAALNVRTAGVGGGTAVPQYGIRVDAAQSYNGASAMYGVWSKAGQNVGGPNYGVWGESSGTNSTTEGHGVHGKSTYNTGAVNGGNVGVYGEAVALGTNMAQISHAAHFEHKGAYGALNVGVQINTVTGGTTVQPIRALHDGAPFFDITTVGAAANGIMNLSVPGVAAAGVPPAIMDVRGQRGGVGGPGVPSYGIKVDSTSWNTATAAYGLWARGYQAVGGTSYGVWGETQQGSSGVPAHGVHGKTTYNSGLVNGGPAGVYGEAVLDPASTLFDQLSCAGMFEHKGTKGGWSVGVWASTVAGSTYPKPLVCQHAGATVFEVTPTNVIVGATQYSVTPGANPKLLLYDAGAPSQYGLGISNGQLDYMVPTGASHAFYIAGVKYGALSNAGLAITGNITATGTITSTAGPLATVSQLANYLPLTGGLVSGILSIGDANGQYRIFGGATGYLQFGTTASVGKPLVICGWGGVDLPTLDFNSAAINLNAGGVNIGSFTSTGLVMNTGKALSGTGGLALNGQVNVTGNILLKGQINVQSTGAGQGYATMIPGNATNSGYIEFFSPAGTRTGYIGYTDASSLVITPEGGRSLKVASPIYADTTKRVYQQATAAAGGEIYISASAPSGGADGDIWLQYV